MGKLRSRDEKCLAQCYTSRQGLRRVCDQGLLIAGPRLFLLYFLTLTISSVNQIIVLLRCTDTMNDCKMEAYTGSLLCNTMQNSVFHASFLGMFAESTRGWRGGSVATLFQLASWFLVSYEIIYGESGFIRFWKLGIRIMGVGKYSLKMQVLRLTSRQPISELWGVESRN